MPDLIPDEYVIFDRHPVPTWIPGPAPDTDPGFAGMTILRYLKTIYNGKYPRKII
jgi:hypothetical protein